jgi:glucose/mannose-6-phosphate isomerase
MEDILYPLHTFKEQFSYIPEIRNQDFLYKRKHIIICGMGGSAISVSLIKLMFPQLSITLHNDYGLPHMEDKENTMLILNSYSGNTEEVLDTFARATEEQIKIAILSRGGELIRVAEFVNAPHIVLPNLTVEPRFSIGHQLIGLLALMSEHEKIKTLREAVMTFDLAKAHTEGKTLAEQLEGTYPVLYASKNLYPVAYLIKAAVNEGSKVPCFVNCIPEANHNELQSFVSNNTKENTSRFSFVMFTSSHDHERTKKRFSTMTNLYQEEGFKVTTVPCDHTSIPSLFELILTGYYAATYLAVHNKVEPYTTPLIQEFKRRMAA